MGMIEGLDIPKIIRAAAKNGVKRLKIGELELEFDTTEVISRTEMPMITKTWTSDAIKVEQEADDELNEMLEQENIAQLDLLDPDAYEEYHLKKGNEE